DRDPAETLRTDRMIMDQGRDQGQRHAEHAEAVAAPAAHRAGETPQREDEAHPRHQIGEHHPGGRCGSFPHQPRSFFLYMASIRAVTAKPPKMLMLAITTASSPSHLAPCAPAAAAAI